MKKLHLVASAMLGAFGLALPTIASAAPVFPRALVSGVSHHEPTLVQYGGGDDDEGGGYSAPRGGNSGGGGGYSSPGGGYSHPRGGDGGARAAIQIMRRTCRLTY